MSHYIYKKKKFLELPDGRILPLCLSADSSLTSKVYDRYGRGHYFHPKSWCINTFSRERGILIDKQDFNNAVMQAYEEELECIRKCKNRNAEQNYEPDEEFYGYYGTVYPAGRKMKHMKSFYSTRRTIPAETFLKENKFDIYVSVYDPNNYKTIAHQTVTISTVDDIIKAEQIYEELHSKSDGHMCLGILGLAGAD